MGAVYLFLSVVAGFVCLRLLWGSSDSLLQFATAVACGAIAYLLAKAGHRRRVPVFRNLKILTEFARRHDTPVALYLRRFYHDAASGSGSIEEQIALGLGSYALFVAVGRPGEKLPSLGAFRLYVPDEQWRDVIQELLSIGSLVIFRWAPGGHLGWELKQVRREDKLDQTAFVLPMLPPGTNVQEFLPEEIFQQVDVGGLTGSMQSSPGLLMLNDDGTTYLIRTREGFSDQDRLPLEDMASSFAEKLELPVLDRSQRVALRRLYGRTERIAMTVGLLTAVIPSLVVALGAVFVLDALTPFDIIPLSWDHDIIFAVAGAAAFVSVVVFFLASLLVSRLTGRS